jgi:hypothetical protein
LPRASPRGFRPSTPADATAIAALLEEAGLHPVVGHDVERWKYWQSDGGWSDTRSFVLTEGERLIAHGAVVPGTLAWGQQRARVVQVVDWAARPGAAGAGFALMKRLGQLADGMLSIGGTAQTRQILPHLGFKPAGEVVYCVRTLRPLRIVGSRLPAWRLLPRVARSLVWTARAPPDIPDDFTMRRVSPDALAGLGAALPAPAADFAVLERSAPSLRHILGCPLVPMELHALERSGRVQGYFLLAIAGRQARLADCWMATGDPGDWRSLVRRAVQRAREYPDTAEVVAWASDPLLSRALGDCGFHARGAHPVRLMMRAGRAGPASVRVQMLDTDAAYLEPHGDSLLA